MDVNFGGYKIGDILPDMEVETDFGASQQFEIVSKVAFLLGVEQKVFHEEGYGLSAKIYNQLSMDKNAVIIRDLCRLRTSLECHFLQVCKAIQQEYKSITQVPEWIPQDAIMQLQNAGIDLYKYNKQPTPFLIEINKNIKSRIFNCKRLFPDWLEWNYLSDIFIMPDGLTEEGTKKAASFYYENQPYYPFKVYMNWPAEDQGNILYNDKKFVTLLYSWNGDEFRDLSLVSDASDYTKQNIYDFINKSTKCMFIVDCENSDPYAFCAALQNLDKDKLAKIERIVLYDDVHAASAWDILKDYVDVPIEYILIERLKDNKSLADVKVTARTCQEHYQNQVDSFVLVSSDSDYWGMIETMPDANFLVMIEHEKCSGALKDALLQKGIFYCYIDSFYVGNVEEMKTKSLVRELRKILDDSFSLNVKSLIKELEERTRIDMTTVEEEQFIKKYIRTLELEIGEDGNMEIIINSK